MASQQWFAKGSAARSAKGSRRARASSEAGNDAKFWINETISGGFCLKIRYLQQFHISIQTLTIKMSGTNVRWS